MSVAGLFSASSPRIFTLSPGQPFLRALACQLASETALADDPSALAGAVIYVPNRRSARQLALELFDAAGAPGALLMPDIRTLGDLEDAASVPGAEAALADLPAPVTDAKRLGALIQMAQRFFQVTRGRELPLQSALGTARELARLLDQAALSGGVDWPKLPDLVEDTQLAGHWELSVRFLEIITETWPDWLGERGVMDAAAYREAAARALADDWLAHPPEEAVIIAGSTGSTPAGRVLMTAALALPRGAVILPGAERGTPPSDWAAMAAAPSHPQNVFTQTLCELELQPHDLKPWPNEPPPPGALARERLIAEALSPAELTGDWHERIASMAGNEGRVAFTQRALAGFAVIEAADEAEEARLAALILRETLERPGETAALVTPDAGLARRVSALLKRWELDVHPSSGTPLLHTHAGSLVSLLLSWWTDPADPVAMATLLRHAGVVPPAATDAFERLVLRGPRWWSDPTDLAGRLKARLTHPRQRQRMAEEDIADAVALAGWFAEAASVCPEGPVDGTILGEVVSALIEVFGASETVWAGEAGRSTAEVFANLSDIAAGTGPQSSLAWGEAFRSLASDIAIAPDTDGHPRLAIWGPLEARLQSADRLVLAGLNEDVWPQQPPADAFLPRHFRRSLGLPDPEERMGLAAHDFAQLACQRDVTCLYSARRDDAPAVASRWIWRLKTLVRGALGDATNAALAPQEGHDPREWLKFLEQPDKAFRAQVAPRPCPPPKARPRRLSVTRIDWLQRDPYAIYASEILRLRPLDRVGKSLDARERGTAIHAALERLETDGGPDTAEALLQRLEEELADAGYRPEDLAAERAVLARTVDWYLGWRAGRAPSVRRSWFEVEGGLDLQIAGAPFRLTAKADRIDLMSGGELTLLDFKTGAPKTDKQIASGIEQQMPLQALIAREGGFADVPAAPVEALIYVAFRARREARELKEDPGTLANSALEGLNRLVAAYREEGQVFLSAPRVQFVGFDYGYNRLARRAEWASEVGDE